MINSFAETETYVTSEPVTVSNVDRDLRYVMVDVPYIRANLQNIKEHCEYAAHRIKQFIVGMKNIPYDKITGTDITWFYNNYNIYNIAAGSVHFYTIYKHVCYAVNQYFKITGKPKPSQMWMQSWINFHNADEVLSVHDHTWDLHGYVSIEPQDTETVFLNYRDDSKELYRVKNQVGKIYVGPGYRPHYVNNLSNYTEKRITMGFDLMYEHKTNYNSGFIPILLED